MEESVINVISNTCTAVSSEKLYCYIYIRLLSNNIIMTMSDTMRTRTIMNVLQQNVNVNLWPELWGWLQTWRSCTGARPQEGALPPLNISRGGCPPPGQGKHLSLRPTAGAPNSRGAKKWSEEKAGGWHFLQGVRRREPSAESPGLWADRPLRLVLQTKSAHWSKSATTLKDRGELPAWIPSDSKWVCCLLLVLLSFILFFNAVQFVIGEIIYLD